jgi:hypothetical protein
VLTRFTHATTAQGEGLFGERMTDLKRGTPDWVHAARTPEGLGPLGNAGGGAADVPAMKLAGIHTSPHAAAAAAKVRS